MIKAFLKYIIVLVTMSFWTCTSDHALSLKIPENGFKVVQHIPKELEGRSENVLYLNPRRIRDSEFNTVELQIFVDSMYDVMQRNAGVGIAANQLGKRLQIFMIEAKINNPRYQILGPVKYQVFINPIITKVSEKRKNFWHGCLSAKGEKRGNVATFEWIEYKSQNLKGEIQEGRLDGFAAVIFQHEFRHLMKGTYLDHANHFLSRDELDEKLNNGELPFFEYAADTLPLLIEGFMIDKNIEDFI